MKKRIFFVLTGLLPFSLAGIIGLSSYADTAFISQGRLEFDNNTPDNRADDVIFDVDDLKVLDLKINDLSNAVTELENNSDVIDQARQEGKQEGITQTMVGTAIESKVLAGETFTNSTGVGLTGSMPNHGALNWTPSSATTLTIQPGYYSGGTLDSSTAYNKGMEDADGRVNEESESYIKGKEEGLKRVNKIYLGQYRSNKKRTVDITDREGWENLESYNFFCEVRGITHGAGAEAQVEGTSVNLSPQYDKTTGEVTIPALFAYADIPDRYYFFTIYDLYLVY